MPATLAQIAAQTTGVLSATERRATLKVLREESTVTPPTADQVTTALDALDGEVDTSGRQELRAELAAYKSGQAVIDGGTDAVTLDPVIVRWGVRNAIRLLLGFAAEPRPISGTEDAIQLVSLNLASYDSSEGGY